MPIFLSGLAIQFYRGIGPEVQYLGPFSDFNFFIGANNAGKSTVLEFLHRHLPSPKDKSRDKRPTFGALDRYSGDRSGPTVMAIGFPMEQFVASTTDAVAEGRRARVTPRVKAVARRIADSNGLIWLKFTHDARPSQLQLLADLDAASAAKLFPEQEWRAF